MFFSKVVLFAISLGVISVLATPHAHHHALHRRAFAARVASTSLNSSDVAVKREDSPNSDCDDTSEPSSIYPSDAGMGQNTPGATPTLAPTSPQRQPPTTMSSTDTDVNQNTPHTALTRSPTSPPPQQPSATTSNATQSPDDLNVKGQFAGDGTWFIPGLGSCGRHNTETDFIAALTPTVFNKYPDHGNSNNNPLCGRSIKVNYKGKSVVVQIVDTCGGCKGDYDVDMSPAAFQVLAPQGVGRIRTAWSFV